MAWVFPAPVRACALILCLLGGLAGSASALDRGAFTFTRYDLEVRIVPTEQTIAVHGRISLRNDSTVTQRTVALQISSALSWESIHAGDKDLTWAAQTYTTDIDHTGSVTEAVANLPAPVPPKGTVEVEVVYGGTIAADATRLVRIGVPETTAARSDWDQIGADFTAVRGVGYVCWYPVALDAVSLSDGSAMFQALGEWKAREAAMTMKLALSVVSDQMVVTNGRLLGQRARAEADGTVQERDIEFASLGGTVPTFAIANYTLLERAAVNVFHLLGQSARAQEYALAAEKLQPFLDDWFGTPKEKVSIVELPAGDAPFDSGTMLFTPLSADRDAVEIAVAHQLTHAALRSERPWISEGLAHFAQALVVERQYGRRQALAYLQQFQPALAAAESQALGDKPASSAADSDSAGPQPLIRTGDELFFRSKAMFVWWMLRDMIGDDALGRAIRAYRAADDREPSYMQRLLEAQSGKRLEWFFDDWVYRDHSLPDFRVTSVFARQMLPANYTITVTVENLGDTAAEVPIVVPFDVRDAHERLMLPAHGSAVARINVPVAPAEVVVNDGSVPESKTSNNRFPVPKPVPAPPVVPVEPEPRKGPAPVKPGPL